MHAVILLVVSLACLPQAARAQEYWTADDTLDALEGAPYMVQCIVRLEVGGVGYDPYAIGAAGEQGVAQILPSWNGGGQWDEFFYGSWTGIPPEARSTFDPFQSVWFLTVYGSEHGYGAWSTARYC